MRATLARALVWMQADVGWLAIFRAIASQLTARSTTERQLR
jgi:hypothetical protein